MKDSKIWVVKTKVMSFTNKHEAQRFERAFIDAFCAMRESEGVALSTSVELEKVENGN